VTAVEIGVIVMIGLQGVVIYYLSAIWHQLVAYGRGRFGRYD
jgi:hypothetical protein